MNTEELKIEIVGPCDWVGFHHACGGILMFPDTDLPDDPLPEDDEKAATILAHYLGYSGEELPGFGVTTSYGWGIRSDRTEGWVMSDSFGECFDRLQDLAHLQDYKLDLA